MPWSLVFLLDITLAALSPKVYSMQVKGLLASRLIHSGTNFMS